MNSSNQYGLCDIHCYATVVWPVCCSSVTSAFDSDM